MSERWNNRALFLLLWPLIVEQILAVTMGAADTVMVRVVGEFAIAGVNIVDNINNLLIIAFAALCTGGSVVVSQYIGRRDAESSRAAAKQLAGIVVAVALLIMIVAIIGRRQIVWFFYGKMENDVMDAAALYFLITALSYPSLALYNANAALFRAAGNSRVPMLIALLVNIVNIGGNAFFILILKIGVAGAALSTLISRTAAALVTFLMLNKSRGPISLSGILKTRFNRAMVRNILNVGLPSGLESSMFQVGRLLTQRIFTVFGKAAMAGNAIAGVINSFSFMPGNAFGMALLTIVGQCIGAGDYAAAKKETFKIMKFAYLSMIILSGAIYIFTENLIGLFSLSLPAHDYAKSFLRVHCISMMIGWPMSFALPNALRAAGDARYVMIVAAASMWTVRVSAAYLFTYVLGIGPLGVWLAMGADFISRGSFYLIRWIRGRWQYKRVIED